MDTIMGASFRHTGGHANNAPQDGSPLLDDHLHDTLLGVFSHQVNPLVRIIHWPSFVEQARALRHSRKSQVYPSTVSQYSESYFSAPPFDAAQQGIYPDPSMVSSPGQTIHSRSDSAFLALLYSVYYAATLAIMDSSTAPDLGNNITAFDLATTFKQEISTRISALNEDIADSESLEMLQALVLNLVRKIYRATVNLY